MGCMYNVMDTTCGSWVQHDNGINSKLKKEEKVDVATSREPHVLQCEGKALRGMGREGSGKEY